MKKNSIYDVNYLWIMLVFLHLAGSVIVSVIGLVPLGEEILIGGVCVILYYAYKESANAVFLSIMIFAASVMLMIYLPGEYHSSFLMNLILLVFILYTARCSHVFVTEYVNIKKIKPVSILLILILTVCGIVISGYINGLSMIFFQNHAAASLDSGAEHKLECIFVYAILPAVIEELIFRGCIFKGTGCGKKGVLISAVLFALLHMNVNQMCYALFMGLFFGVVVMVTGNVLITIMMHLFFNLFSVLQAAFAGTQVVEKIYSICINGYYVFFPVFQGNGGQSKEPILTGFIICILAGAAAFVLLKFLEKMEKVKKADDIPSGWKPDIRFGIGCLLCIIVAAILR